MTANTTGFVRASRGASFAAMRSSACETSRAECKRRAWRRALRAAASGAVTSALELELGSHAQRRHERAGLLPLGRSVQAVPRELATPVQPRQAQLRRRIDVTL